MRPFVGPRPFTAEETHLLFGRDRDALLLRDKIFSAPLTILYAPSGVGKTSLLQAKVEPMLREQDAHVVHCAPWVAPDPCQAIKNELRSSIPTSLRSAPLAGSLVEITRAASAALDRPIVLFLDQFEELLLRRADAVKPLAAEIGALVHAALNVHVVIALREEFLASLDVLRTQIVTLLSSTYRLRPLDDDGVREAIVEPAKLCGGTVEKELVETLLRDLRASEGERQQPTAGLLAGYVELPFLQLVCQQLWEASEAEGHQLTVQQYRRLGEHIGIIEKYVRDLTEPLPFAQRSQLGRLLDFLAPRSGVKMAWEATDLGDRSHVAADVLEELLAPLADKFVVRIRRTPRTTWYEVYHDAFIGVLRKWVGDQRRSELYRRVTRRAAAAVFVLLAVIGLVVWYGGVVADRRQTSGLIHKLIAEPLDSQRVHTTVVVDGVTRWLLAKADRDKSGSSVSKLLDLLSEAKDPIQRFYAREDEAEVSIARRSDRGGPAESATGKKSQPVSQYKADTVSICPRQSQDDVRSVACAQEAGVIEIRRGRGVPLFTPALEHAWRGYADFLADSLGMPPPMKLVSAMDWALPPEGLRASIGGREFDLSWLAESTLVSEEQVSRAVRPQLRALADSEIKTPAPGGRWWRVPRWSLPLWRATGQPRRSREQMVGLVLLSRLTAEPELLLTRSVAGKLVDRARMPRPRGARGRTDSIRAVLVRLVEQGHSIRGLGRLLVALAGDRGSPPDSLAVRVWDTAIELSCRLPRPGEIGPPARQPDRTSRDVADVLSSLRPGKVERDARRVQLQLCLLADLLAEGRLDAADSLVRALPPAMDSSWSADERYVLGYRLVHRVAAVGGAKSPRNPLPDLEAAFRAWPDGKLESVYSELWSLCHDTWVTRHCWAMLDTLIGSRPNSFWLALSFGFDLAGSQTTRPDAENALGILRRAERLLATQPEAIHARMRAWVDLGEARALHTLAQYDGSVDLRSTARSLGLLLENPSLNIQGWPSKWAVLGELITNRILADSFSDAERAVADAHWEGRMPVLWAANAFFLQLARGNLDSAVVISEAALKDTVTPPTLYLAALGRLLDKRLGADSVTEQFLRTSHEYRDYIRMLQFWSLSKRGDTLQALRLIESRWAQIDSSSWRERLEAGDKAVWREMLIGYFASHDAVARERARRALLAPLERARLITDTPYEYLGDPLTALRCETYFYDGLLQSVSGDPTTRIARAVESFEKALSTNYKLYFEYHMARVLRDRL